MSNETKTQSLALFCATPIAAGGSGMMAARLDKPTRVLDVKVPNGALIREILIAGLTLTVTPESDVPALLRDVPIVDAGDHVIVQVRNTRAEPLIEDGSMIVLADGAEIAPAAPQQVVTPNGPMPYHAEGTTRISSAEADLLAAAGIKTAGGPRAATGSPAASAASTPGYVEREIAEPIAPTSRQVSLRPDEEGVVLSSAYVDMLVRTFDYGMELSSSLRGFFVSQVERPTKRGEPVTLLPGTTVVVLTPTDRKALVQFLIARVPLQGAVRHRVATALRRGMTQSFGPITKVIEPVAAPEAAPAIETLPAPVESPAVQPPAEAAAE